MLKLKQMLNTQDLSMTQLSALSGVPYRTVQDAIRRGDCRVSTAYTLATALGLTLNDLWEPDQVAGE